MSEEWQRGLADAVVAEAAAERRRVRRERELLEAEASFDGVLAAAAHHPEVVLVGVDGTEYRGTLASIGPDAVVVRRTGSTTILPRAAVVAVGISGTGPRELGGGATSGAVDDGPELVELVAELVDQGAEVRVRIGTTNWAGVFRAVGEDVAVLALRAGPCRYVRLASVTEISV